MVNQRVRAAGSRHSGSSRGKQRVGAAGSSSVAGTLHFTVAGGTGGNGGAGNGLGLNGNVGANGTDGLAIFYDITTADITQLAP